MSINNAVIAGKCWMEDRLIEAEERSLVHQWTGLGYKNFEQALTNANCPTFPHFENDEEMEAAHEAAWDWLQDFLVEAVDDLCYSVGFPTEGEDLETLVLEADQGETIRSICERLWEHREFEPEGA